jgi:hypothetical protein
MFCSDVKAPAALHEGLAAVGTIWGASKLGGPNIKKCLQLRKLSPLRNRFSGEKRAADLFDSWGRPLTQGEKQVKAPCGTRRSRGPSIQGKIRRDNVGKIPLAAGLGSNRRGLLERGDCRRRGEPVGIGA